MAGVAHASPSLVRLGRAYPQDGAVNGPDIALLPDPSHGCWLTTHNGTALFFWPRQWPPLLLFLSPTPTFSRSKTTLAYPLRKHTSASSSPNPTQRPSSNGLTTSPGAGTPSPLSGLPAAEEGGARAVPPGGAEYTGLVHDGAAGVDSDGAVEAAGAAPYGWVRLSRFPW